MEYSNIKPFISYLGEIFLIVFLGRIAQNNIAFSVTENKFDNCSFPPLGLNATFEKLCSKPDFDIKENCWVRWAAVPFCRVVFAFVVILLLVS